MSVAGKWHISVKTPIGMQQFNCEFEPTDSQWRGKIEGQGSAVPVEDLKVEGDTVGFQARVKGPLGMMDMTFSGTATGDEMSGTCQTRFGNFPVTGQRA